MSTFASVTMTRRRECSRRRFVVGVDTCIIEKLVEVVSGKPDHGPELDEFPARDLVTTISFERKPQEAVLELASHLLVVGRGESENLRHLHARVRAY